MEGWLQHDDIERLQSRPPRLREDQDGDVEVEQGHDDREAIDEDRRVSEEREAASQHSQERVMVILRNQYAALWDRREAAYARRERRKARRNAKPDSPEFLAEVAAIAERNGYTIDFRDSDRRWIISRRDDESFKALAANLEAVERYVGDQ
jgi:hypothetical protein